MHLGIGPKETYPEKWELGKARERKTSLESQTFLNYQVHRRKKVAAQRLIRLPPCPQQAQPELKTHTAISTLNNFCMAI